ncbi:MAG TPA: acylphosphatase [Candidatus Binatia bacterium]|jgi:acylphosphatase
MAGGDNARVHLRIHGQVQGVFFRASTEAEARRLGLTGWVRNRPDGSVEVIAEGPKAKLEDLVAWCRRGPPRAQVDRVEVEWGEAAGEFSGFRTSR